MAETEELVSPEQAERYRRCVSQAKQEARNGNLEESIRLFREAHEIHPSEKLMVKVQKLEEALASLALNQEDDGFVNVCQSGLMLYGEMHDKLFDHQREGIAFLYSLYRDSRKGGILADDMGLGKTIQIIAFLSGMFDSEYIRSVLLVMPTTLVSNWMREFASWTPGLRVKVFHGTSKVERSRNLERIQKRNGVLITTYQMILNNWQQLSSCGGQEFVWDYVILDEAHKIKTPSAKTTKCVHAIPCRNRILLTGTPVQNNLQELWALFDFACQGSLLGTMKTFRMEYENPITKAREKDATPGEKALGLKMSENLMSIIKPYFLRRSKDDIQKKLKSGPQNNLLKDQSKAAAPEMPSLPRKNDFIVWVYVSPIQEEIYRNFLSLDHIKELLMTTRSPLAELNVLKKLCDHPRLLSARACSQLGLATSEYSEREEGGENEADELWGKNMDIERIPDEILIEESGKVRFLIALLDRLQEEGHQTLVFSQSRKMLDILERILTHRRFKLMRIDGTVTHLLEREKRIDAFQNDKDYSVFLLTTQVGGVGLTLTAATRVVIFDPSWNPATDAQAVDRAYRIGQKENVVIYRLITCGTVEEKIYRRQVFKDSLIRQTTGDKKNPYRYFTKQELRELFTLGNTRSSATQLQLQSLHRNQRKTDVRLDEHIAYLYSLEIFGLSDHDLMYTRETGHEDQAEDEEAHRYIEQRVQKAQELVQLESQMKDQLAANMRHTTEGAWLRATDSSSVQPRKKSPKPSPVYSAPTPVPVQPPDSGDVISVETDDEEDLADVSFKMTSLVIEDVADDSPVLDVSHMDVSLSKAEATRHASLQECEQKHSLSTPPSRFVSNEEDDHSGSKMTSHEPPTGPNDSFNDVCVAALQQSVEYISDDDVHEAQAKMEISLEVLGSPCREASQAGERDATTALILQAGETSEHAAKRKSGRSEILAREGSLVSSSPYQADFNLMLEDSETQPQDVSDKEMLLEETENTGFHLRLDSRCSSAAQSRVGENRSIRSLQASENVMGSPTTDGSDSTDDASMDNSDVPVACKKKPVQRIVSDSEEDEESSIINLGEGEHGKAFPSNYPGGIYVSTPKSSEPLADLCFSPQFELSKRRSTASRRSLANVVFDQVEDVAESITDGSPERHFPGDLEEELAQEYSGREPAETEEEWPGETVHSKGKSRYSDEADSPLDNSIILEGMVP
ncbi:DNA excision repair protein ERCC-6-like [Heteronotia binoei]|uniref:DNA excision repair protein ERCC-6-like n=1 Tax=Heteronotia binoei TaxID=13085 RepID=UPI002931404F|nr:DNA excision repair protein ERCC-6-like [Heteronotia binoei]